MAMERLKASSVNTNMEITPVLMLCDNSGTMAKFTQIVHNCLENMVSGLKRRPSTGSCIDLCVATFNTDFKVLVPFTRLANIQNIPEIKPTELATFLGEAVSKSVQLLAEEKAKLKAAQISYCQPLLIVLSDGLPEYENEDVTAAGIKAIQDKIRQEKWSCIPILIGQEFADRKTVLAELASPDKNGIRREFKFTDENQISNLMASLSFAGATIRAVAENGCSGTEDLMEHFRRLSILGNNHKFLFNDKN